jgi:hypothetical protein
MEIKVSHLTPVTLRILVRPDWRVPLGRQSGAHQTGVCLNPPLPVVLTLDYQAAAGVRAALR